MKTVPVIVALLAVLSVAVPGLSAEEKVHAGTVIYTKNAENYTYIRLKEADKKIWLATSPIQVSVGDPIEYVGGDVMKKFESKAMNKTFDEIRFVTRIRVVNNDPLPDNKAMASIPHPKSGTKEDPKESAVDAPKNSPVAPTPKKGEIIKTGKEKTIEEIFSGREQLKDRPVTLRGKVIKVSRNILKKNWITLADGTGMAPDDRIVAVTTDLVTLGDVATVTGILKTNVNLGAGYKYKVLIDDAEIAK